MEKLIVDDTPYETQYTEKYKKRKAWEPRNPKLVAAFIPGTIRELNAAPGRRVKAGDTLFVFEAMKMVNTVKAQEDGIVKAVHVAVGAMVAKGQLIIEFE